ncbi:MAG: acyl-CoA dehydratase activase-related protein [Bacillota bacterium]|nr:acyl-CoA dehydratase activase-related protein [Bacillota bacterium]
MKLHTGLDIGSTTCKIVVMDQNEKILYSQYKRHFSDVRKTVEEILEDCLNIFKDDLTTINITGSGGLIIHKLLDLPFVQEVVASTKAIKTQIPQTDVAIELGGEDSKITYLKGSIEQRMNSICAGGTGAFIDQMASLLETDASGLNSYAENFQKTYPIASRCGVFAKTDIQALINQGASKEDISVSVFQSVVNQTISNLACGRPIRGKVAFLGGPLHFLPELRKRFALTLDLKEDEIIVPENPQLFVAYGAALLSKDGKYVSFQDLYNKIKSNEDKDLSSKEFLDPLFACQEDLDQFRKRHESHKVKDLDLKDYVGPLYLGIDAGSTTSKLVLLDSDNNIRYSFYGNNKGKPLEVIADQVKTIYDKLEDGAYIASSGITGYGEEFIKTALNIDYGEVETIAHLKAAMYYNPKVDFIVDIGGQDMKAMKIEDEVISSILLNEACSSGCGSFLETFANSIGMSVSDFTEKALLAKNPVDLGSRCTVFMNSMVKQAQKEGAEVGDIAAGLSYSIIKNAIQKVIKIRDPESLGQNIVVQGGTFYGDAILRAFELITGKEVIRPRIAGLMGAFGMALISKEKAGEKSTILSKEDLEEFSYTSQNATCRQCTNYCRLTINKFSNGQRYITGNRCERGAGISRSQENTLPNLYEYKYKRVFDYDSLDPEKAPRGRVGLLRVLNMYENYPFWHTFFTSLGYSVVLSSRSSREIYEKGIESITSETACYPAKISHGHLEDLIDKGLDFIFYPSVFYEEKEFSKADNTLNCPVVAGYSEVLKNNVESLEEKNIRFLNPFISFDNRKKLEKRMVEIFPDLPSDQVKKAVRAAYEEQDRYSQDVLEEGRRALAYVKEKNIKGIVLCGRPYHVDPEINHGIPELINSMGLALISEDALAKREDVQGKLRVLDQWTYHSRLYRAAQIVGQEENLEIVQLNSFGCGIDAITTDQVNEILHGYNKTYTVIKIDEVSNLGAVKIRLRSLIEATERRKLKEEKPVVEFNEKPLIFTKEMAKAGYTILMPQMAPIHFELIEAGMRDSGINLEVLESTNSRVIDQGLKYVNNDACYPSMFVVGQIIDAIKSGKYDTDKLAVLMSQTGGACRASNYVGFIRKALKEAGFGHVPVIGLSFQSIEFHPGLFADKSIIKIFRQMTLGTIYGDLLMRLSNRTRPYEKIKGSTDKLDRKWMEIFKDLVNNYKKKDHQRLVKECVKDYEKVQLTGDLKPRVGIVGEILVKYLPSANNNVQKLLEAEGAEVVVNDLIDFIYYSMKNATIKYQSLSKGYFGSLGAEMIINYIEGFRKPIRQALEGTRFGQLAKIEDLMDFAQEFVSLGNQYGEGWLLTGEMIELIHHGANNIVCVQPFGCLPNHITGKGVMKSIRETYANANIVAIDYDASASMTNQENRLKLMMARARENVQADREYSQKLVENKKLKISNL